VTRGERLAVAIGGAVAAAAVVWLGLVGLSRRHRDPAPAAAPSASTTPAPAGRKIKARLFYVADDGVRLMSVERDVAFAEGTVEQARQILEAQVAPVAEPLVSAVPPGTVLRGIFVAEGGEAFVDLSHEVVDAHSGGSTNETLTVYTLVNALTANLPAVTAVQVLVEGKEVDTLVGHIDLRRPLEKNLTWVQ
jgi:Sporulation and spore germination